MIRQLIEAFTRELRWLRLANALSKSADAAFARDTALLETVQRRRVTVPTECPLPDCSTCQPSAPPLDVVAYEERSRDIAYAVGWLLEQWPDAWYFYDGDKLLFDIAADLIDLKLRVRAGSIAR